MPMFTPIQYFAERNRNLGAKWRTSDLLLNAYQLGHAWNPKYPALADLDLRGVSLLSGTEQEALDLIKSFQESDLNFVPIVLAFHNRSPVYDGIIGPATRALAELPRCPLPDFTPPPDVEIYYPDPEIRRAIESMQINAQMGSGSWPSCDPERPGVNSFRVRLDTSNCPATIKAYLDKSLEAVVAAYAEMGCALRYIQSSTGECELEKRFQSLAGSVIGWNEFPTPNTCDQTISGRLDTGYAPSDYRYWANLEAHETGHGVGLSHTRGHIMNPSILLVWPLSWKGGPSEAAMKRYFGGIPVPTPGPGPGPGPIPPGEKVKYSGSFISGGQVYNWTVEGPKPSSGNVSGISTFHTVDDGEHEHVVRINPVKNWI